MMSTILTYHNNVSTALFYTVRYIIRLSRIFFSKGNALDLSYNNKINRSMFTFSVYFLCCVYTRNTFKCSIDYI